MPRDGDGAGVKGDAGAEGRLLPGITLEVEGIWIGIDGDVCNSVGRDRDLREKSRDDETGGGSGGDRSVMS